MRSNSDTATPWWADPLVPAAALLFLGGAGAEQAVEHGSDLPLVTPRVEREWQQSTGEVGITTEEISRVLGAQPRHTSGVTTITSKSTLTPDAEETAAPILADARIGEHAYARLNQYRNLVSNWNGWGADPPPETAFRVAQSVMRQFAAAGLPIDDVTLGVDEVFFIYSPTVTAEVYFDGGVILISRRADGLSSILEVPAGRVAESLARLRSGLA